MTYLSTRTRFNRHYTDPIPTAVAGPVLQKALDGFEAYRLNTNLTKGGPVAERTPGGAYVAELIAADTGGKADTWYRKMTRIINQEYDECSITVLDHFLVALDCHHWWYSEPLVEFYFSEEILSGQAA